MMKIGFPQYNELPHEKKSILLFPLCTRTKNTLGQCILTFGIHFITMVGQAIHGGAAIHGPKEPLWELRARSHCVGVCSFVLTWKSVHVFSACMCLIQWILSSWPSNTLI